MEELYHYTALDVLYKIVQNHSINLRATHFRYFGKDDYEWVRDTVKPIIRKMCMDKDEWFDPGLLTANPFIISFCKNGSSQYMWKTFGDDHEGIKLVLNKELLTIPHEIAIDEKGEEHEVNGLETLLPCSYINRENEIPSVLMSYEDEETLCGWDFSDKMRLSSVALMQSKFTKEQEYRHICLFPTVSIVYTDFHVEDDPMPPYQYIFLQFPQDLLLGVQLGKDTTKQDLWDIARYLQNEGFHVDVSEENKFVHVNK